MPTRSTSRRTGEGNTATPMRVPGPARLKVSSSHLRTHCPRRRNDRPWAPAPTSRSPRSVAPAVDRFVAHDNAGRRASVYLLAQVNAAILEDSHAEYVALDRAGIRGRGRRTRGRDKLIAPRESLAGKPRARRRVRRCSRVTRGARQRTSHHRPGVQHQRLAKHPGGWPRDQHEVASPDGIGCSTEAATTTSIRACRPALAAHLPFRSSPFPHGRLRTNDTRSVFDRIAPAM
jgi:hypothetical protein